MRHPLPLRSVAALVLLAACQDPTTGVVAPRPDAPRAAKAAPAPGRTVVMDHLDAPRGLAFAPDGALYVTEAGKTTMTSTCTTLPRGRYCYSGTGAISRWRRGMQERVASGLPSYYNADMLDITGPQHLDFQGMGSLYFTIGWGGPPAGRAGLGAFGAAFGTLNVLRPSGAWTRVADVAAFEQAHNPDGEVFDSNPYGLLAEGSGQYVTDAGGNDLLHVDMQGEVSLVAVFPRVPAPPTFGGSAQAVPTEVVRGPDGALYVSTLTGVPFTTGAAIVYRVTDDGTRTVHASGFKTITDLAFGADGSLYVLQFATGDPFFAGPGKLWRVAPDGTRTTVAENLPAATAVAIGDDGAFYVAINGNVAGTGQVLRIVP